jgi:hypothetical protein
MSSSTGRILGENYMAVTAGSEQFKTLGATSSQQVSITSIWITLEVDGDFVTWDEELSQISITGVPLSYIEVEAQCFFTN